MSYRYIGVVLKAMALKDADACINRRLRVSWGIGLHPNQSEMGTEV